MEREWEEGVTIPVPYAGPYLDRPTTEEERRAGKPEAHTASPPIPDDLMAEARFRAENAIDTFEVGPEDLRPWLDDEPPL